MSDKVLSVPVQVTFELPPINWTDGSAVLSYLGTIVGIAITLLTLVHPGFQVPGYVQAIVAPLSSVIAGVAQIVNVIMHRKVQIAALQMIERTRPNPVG